MTKNRPIGVTTVGILTVFSALAIFYLALVIWAVSILGGGYGGYGAGSNVHAVYILAVVGFGVLVLVDAISILRGERFGWHLSIFVWILTFIFLCIVYYVWGLVGYFGLYFMGGYPSLESIEIDLVLACPFLYVFGCLLYFRKRHVKEYFSA